MGEHYRYTAEGRRAVKTHLLAGRTGAMRQVRYLPGLEDRLTTCARGATARLQVAEVGNVRINRDAADRRTSGGLHVRFTLSDRTGSAVTEVDGNGMLLSREAYYPFGGTAVWTTRNPTVASYKTRRYSGKERDVTGLVYYGFRYYVPWLMRWLNPDPAGNVDGLNKLCMVKNNAVTFTDSAGLAIRCAHCNEIICNDSHDRVINSFDDISTNQNSPNRMFVEEMYGQHWADRHPGHPLPPNIRPNYLTVFAPLRTVEAPPAEHNPDPPGYREPANLGGGEIFSDLVAVASQLFEQNEDNQRAGPSLMEGDFNVAMGLAAAGGRAASRAASRAVSRVTSAASSAINSLRSSRRSSLRSSHTSLGPGRQSTTPYSRSESVSSSAASLAPSQHTQQSYSTPQSGQELPVLALAEVEEILQPQNSGRYYCQQCNQYLPFERVGEHQRNFHSR